MDKAGHSWDSYMEIERMINEGLGGGMILQEYDAKKYETIKKSYLEGAENGTDSF